MVMFFDYESTLSCISTPRVCVENVWKLKVVKYISISGKISCFNKKKWKEHYHQCQRVGRPWLGFDDQNQDFSPNSRNGTETNLIICFIIKT